LGFVLFQHLSQTQTNSGMPVMAAGVHHPWIAGGKAVAERAMAFIERFAEIQRIHIHAKGDCRPRTPCTQRGDNAGESTFERGEPFLGGALLARTGKFFCQRLCVRQAHAAFGVNHITPHRQLITQWSKISATLAAVRNSTQPDSAKW
jgi:hypothetical protein